MEKSNTQNAPSDKNDWRKELRAKRLALAPETLAAAGHAAAIRLRDFLVAHPEIQTVETYLSIGHELPTEDVVAVCRKLGRRIAVPAWQAGDRNYQFVWFEKGDALVPGPMKIPQPAVSRIADVTQIDLFLVPGLAFDRVGGRIGYGGGWYDRLLLGRRADSLRLGFCLDLQLVDGELPLEPHDQRMDGVLTPSALLMRN